MPSDLAAEIPRMAAAFGIVAVGAVPLGLIALAVSRSPLLPPCRLVRSAWTGADVLFLFGLHFVLTSVIVAVLGLLPFEATASVGGAAGSIAAGGMERYLTDILRAAVTAGTLLLAVALGLRLLVHPNPPRFAVSDTPNSIALGVLAWLVLTPAVFAVHYLALWVLDELGGEPEDHFLARGDLGTDPTLVGLFAASVCLVTPFVEELLFRGVLLGWMARRRGFATVALVAGVLFTAFTVAATSGKPVAIGFAVLLAAGGVLVRRRTVRAVVASAAVFAMAHGAWPSPVPLFVLALGLGWLAARTGGILACGAAHALFNAVSFVYLLRGGGN